MLDWPEQGVTAGFAFGLVINLVSRSVFGNSNGAGSTYIGVRGWWQPCKTTCFAVGQIKYSGRLKGAGLILEGWQCNDVEVLGWPMGW
jgi:hypothetical protein